jgi:hypothetical protein
MRRSSLVLVILGVTLLLVLGGFRSFAGNGSAPSSEIASSATATSEPSPAVAVMPADTQCGAEAGSTETEDMTPASNPCAGVVCNSHSDCATCCQAGGYDLWRCGPLHKCICAQS